MHEDAIDYDYDNDYDYNYDKDAINTPAGSD